MTHDEVRDALPLFVVDADDRQTRRALLDHLAGCEECRRALQEYQLAADALAQSVPQMRPRPGAACADAGGDCRCRGRTARRRQLRIGAGCVLPAPAPAARRVRHGRHGSPPPRRSWPPSRPAGCCRRAAEVSEMRATLALWQARVADAERNAQASQATLVTYRRQLDVMTADDLLLVSLSGLPPANAAQGKAFVSRSQNAILFTARDLPPLPAARVYQLWAVAGGQAISAGTFVPDARGRSQLVADVPALTTRPDALAVTVEPEGGVPAPTGPKYLLGVPAAN